jgi:hypothetical protein
MVVARTTERVAKLAMEVVESMDMDDICDLAQAKLQEVYLSSNADFQTDWAAAFGDEEIDTGGEMREFIHSGVCHKGWLH